MSASTELSAELQAVLQQALSALQQGQPREAQRLCEQVVAAHPTHFEALSLMAVASAHAGQPRPAVHWFERAIAVQGQHASLYTQLGNARLSLHQWAGALANFDQALALEPTDLEAIVQRGNALVRMGRLAEALQAFDDALARQPDLTVGHSNRGAVLVALGRHDEALAALDQALVLAPQDAGTHSQRGNLLARLGRHAEAVEAFDRCLQDAALDADAHFMRGNSLMALGRVPEALGAFSSAVSARPAYAAAWSNRGTAAGMLLDLDAAERHFDMALSLDPQRADDHWNKGLLQLQRGALRSGFEAAEWRWKRASFPGLRRNFSQPLWRGMSSLQGKTVLLHAEQGLGDTLQMLRFVPLVAQRGARVVLEVPRELHPLLQGLAGVSALLSYGDTLPRFDRHCPLMSLPHALRTELDSIPAPAALTVDPTTLARWSQRLGPRLRPRVGLVWNGGAQHQYNALRNVPLSEWLAVLPEGVDWVCLQKEVSDADRAAAAGRPDLSFFDADLTDFGDTGALCALCDLIVSVDTSVAHLAASLGCPTWITLPYAPDWRWLLGREDSPWYPSVRLFRQSGFGDWATSLQAASQAVLQTFPEARARGTT